MNFFTCSKCSQELPLSSKAKGQGRKCRSCHAAYAREYRARNSEKVKEYDLRHRIKRREYHRAYIANWYQTHKEQVKQASLLRYQRTKNDPAVIQKRREWRANNLELVREYNRQYRQRHKGRVAAYVQAKNARKRKAQPAWANEFKMRVIYRTASVMTKLTKRRFEVDHIYPLSSPFMCGLHVETNLRVISRKENMRKGNRCWPGQLPCQTSRTFDPYAFLVETSP